MRTLCGFLNGEGGCVLFGVTPQGKIVGTDLTDESTRSIPDLFRFFEPAVDIHQVRIALDNGKWIYVLRVPRGVPEEAPYMYQGRAYVRNGSRTDTMPSEVLQARLMKRASATIRWEIQEAKGVSVSDLDVAEIAETMARGVNANRIPAQDGTLSPQAALKKLKVMRDDGTMLNAAVALFGTPNAIDFPQCRVHLAHFDGIDKTADYLDGPLQVSGSAFSVINAALEFLRRRLPVAGRILTGVFERKDDPVFPVRVLREALANAVAHRDYSQAGGGVHVAIYANRVEVTNPGSLPVGWTVESLLGDHESQPRNPLIANAMYLRGVIEQWGRGTGTIWNLCQTLGHPAPEFFTRAGSFGVSLFSAVPLVAGYVGVVPRLAELQWAILRQLESRGMAVSELHVALGSGVTRETVRFHLRELKRQGFVLSPGRPGPGAKWELDRAGIDLVR